MLIYIYSIIFLLYRRNTINDKLINYLLDIGCLSYIYYTTEYYSLNERNEQLILVNQTNLINLMKDF